MISTLIYSLCVYMHVCICICVVLLMWGSKDNLWELVSFCPPCGPQRSNSHHQLGGKSLHLLSRLPLFESGFFMAQAGLEFIIQPMYPSMVTFNFWFGCCQLNQGFIHARQALYQLSCVSGPCNNSFTICHQSCLIFVCLLYIPVISSQVRSSPEEQGTWLGDVLAEELPGSSCSWG